MIKLMRQVLMKTHEIEIDENEIKSMKQKEYASAGSPVSYVTTLKMKSGPPLLIVESVAAIESKIAAARKEYPK
jgi:hypothetical protein